MINEIEALRKQIAGPEKEDAAPGDSVAALEKQEQAPIGYIGMDKDISEKKKTEKALQHQIEMVKLISDISTLFIRLPIDEIEATITYALKRIGEFAGVDRSYIYQFVGHNNFMENTNEWCSDKTSLRKQYLKDIPCEQFPWMLTRLITGLVIEIEDVTKMPQEASAEKQEFQKEGIKSILLFPLYIRGRLSGFIGFDSVAGTLTWSEYDVSLLRMFSEVVGSALERRRSQEVLRESEEKFRTITESATDAIIMIDNKGKIIYWNTTAENIFGHTAEEATGRDVHTLISPEKFHNAYQKGFDTFRTTGLGSVIGKTFELSAIRKGGAEFPIEISLSAIQIKGQWHATAIIRDITDRRGMEESLFEEKRFAENLLENSAVATFVLDPQHKVVLWNKACEELTGVHSEDMIGTDNQWKPFYDYKRQTIADVVIDGNPEILPTLYDKFACSTLISNGLHAEGWYNSLNRKKKYILFDAAPIYNSRGELTHVIETLQDITKRRKAEELLDTYRTQLEDLVEERTIELRKTNELLEQDIIERKKTEDALRRSEARFEEAQRVAHLGTWEWNIETDEVYWSDEIYRIFGMDPRKIVPFRWSFMDYIHREDRDRVIQIVDRALEDNRPYTLEARVQHPDGTQIIIQLQGKAYFDNNGKPSVMLGNVQDITERKKMEEEIWKIHKLESIGVLAGGIAHDFNNLMSAILGNISLARHHAKPGDKIYESLHEAEKATKHSKNLSQQLLTFSKGGEPVKKVASLSELVKNSADFALMGSNIKAVYSMPENLWAVEVDEGQVIQVINNIVMNAKQAMQEAGEINIYCENIIVETHSGLPLTAGKYLKTTIHDEGIGILGEHLEKIFDPYFSTKKTGSGLGLAISFSIIKKHEGYLAVDSGVGTGTTFNVYLPASEKQISITGEQDKRLLSGKGRVLVMDDEDVILLIMKKMLQEIGYEAEVAGNGEMAIEKYLNAMELGQPFDAVIIDLTIRGGMGGMECIRELLTIDPAIKAVVSSGYSDDPIMSKYEDFGFKGIITKPYQLEDLSEILFSVIHNRESE